MYPRLKKATVTEPVTINDSEVEIVKSYKYLGVHIQNDLKWNTHINSQIKKANKSMYHVRCLNNLHVDCRLICLLYNSMIASILHFSISSWFNSCSKYLKDNIYKIEKRVKRILDDDCKDLMHTSDNVHRNNCIKLAKKIIDDNNHPLNMYFKLLPHGKYCSARCKTSRFLNMFVPTTIRTINESSYSSLCNS